MLFYLNFIYLFQTGYGDLNRSSRNLLVCLVEINALLHDLGLAASSSPPPPCCSSSSAGNTSFEESNKLNRGEEVTTAPENVELEVLPEQDMALDGPLHVLSAPDPPHCMSQKKDTGAGSATRDCVELKVPGIPQHPQDDEALVQPLQVLSALDLHPTPAREPEADREPMAEPALPDLVPGGVSPAPCLAAVVADFCPGQSLLPDLVTSSSLYTRAFTPYPDIVTSHASHRAGHDSQLGQRASQETNRRSNLAEVNRRSNLAEVNRRSNLAEVNRRSKPEELNRMTNLGEVNRRSNPMTANLHPAWSEAGRRLKDIADGLEVVTSPTGEYEEEVDSRLISRLEAVVGQPRSSLNMFADLSVSLLFNLALYVAVKKLQTVI